MLSRSMLIFLLIASPVFSAELSGFDGFDWGSSRNDIIQLKGSPTKNWGTIAKWEVAGSETIGGYAIDTVRYKFKEGCSELKETVSEPCFLWGGEYKLVAPSTSMFEEITPKISSRYGQFSEEIKTVPIINYKTKKFEGNIFETIRTFDLDDGSRVTLILQERDRPMTDWRGRPLTEGVYSIRIYYDSSEAVASSQKAKANKSKDF